MSWERHVEKTTKHQPKMILTCYDSGMIETRQIVDGVVMAAKPLYQSTIDDIFGHLHGHAKLRQWKGIIPKNIIYVNNESNVLVWTEPAQVRNLNFNRKKDTGKYALPKLVFYLKKNSLAVWAIKNYTENALLHLAPFSNVSETGICMGSASLKNSHMKYWEDVYDDARRRFWHSLFTHELDPYRKLGKNKDKFPTKKLRPLSSKNKRKFIKDLFE